MYRARVVAVSSNKIFADGKWLTCIGNKNFSVGEPVWTDGRCAYGNYRDSQQPLVITAPQENDIGIPIVINALDNWIQFYTYFTRLKVSRFVGEEYRGFNASKSLSMINDYKSNIYLFSKEFYPMNITQNGDIYTLKYTSKNTINLFKNERLIYTKNLPEDTSQTTYIGEVISSSSMKTNFYWGFVEDEFKWAVMAITNEHSGEARNWMGELPSNPGREIECSEGTNTYTQTTFLIDRDSTTPIFQVVSTVYAYHKGVFEDFADEVHISNANQVTNLLSQPSIPLQDNYYYKIISANYPAFHDTGMDDVGNVDSGIMLVNIVVNISLFTPQDEHIIDMEICIFSNITIAKVGINKFLIGINAPNDLRIISNHTDWSHYYDTYTRPGLYLCENGILTPLIKNKPVLNHRLRSMKKIKNWQDRIKQLTINYEEVT